MSTTPNIGLSLTPESSDLNFRQYRQAIDTNMELIDTAVGQTKSDVDSVMGLRKYLLHDSVSGYIPQAKFAMQSTADNYKIYGNSVQSGDITTSVGDLVDNEYKIPVKICGKNLFDYKKLKGYRGSTITISNNIVSYNGAWYLEYPINIKAGTLFVVNYNMTGHNSNGNSWKVCYSDGTVFYEAFRPGAKYEANKDISKILIYVSNATVVNATISNLQLEIGDTATEYEPYHAKAVDLYLDEPLYKSGDNADYVDFKTQKVYRFADDNETVEDITLPPLPLFEGVNNIFVDTATAPSNVSVDYYQSTTAVINEIKTGILSQGGNT